MNKIIEARIVSLGPYGMMVELGSDVGKYQHRYRRIYIRKGQELWPFKEENRIRVELSIVPTKVGKRIEYRRKVVLLEPTVEHYELHTDTPSE